MWRGGGSSMFRFPPVEWNPAVAWCVAPRSKRSRALRSRRGVTAPWQPRGVGVVIQPRRGVVLPPQPPPFLAGLIWVGACFRQTSVVFSPPFLLVVVCWRPDTKRRLALPFSEAGSWRRDLAAASASAAGGAAPAPKGPAASWSSTRWTVGEGRGLAWG